MITGNPIAVRPMTLTDVPLGMRLKAVAGWNQTETDWRLLLDAGTGFVATIDGVPVGTVTVVTYEARLSWIGMLLVDPVYRRRGIGTVLLQKAIKHAKTFGPVYLDATPQGKPLYEHLGFRSVGAFVRMGRSEELSAVNDQRSAVNGQPSAISNQLTRINKEIFADVAHYDAMSFDASRAHILRALYRNAPQYAHCITRRTQVVGYCLGRSGSDFEQIGPVVADDITTAKALLRNALQASTGRDIIVDVPIDDVLVQRETWRVFLSDIGFVERRPFTRMVLGKPVIAGQPGKTFAIAGPEIG